MLQVARREGCIVAKMKSYEPDETLFGDGVGVANFVYFILSGRCQMIESIQVIVTERLGRSFYTLYDPYVCTIVSNTTGRNRKQSFLKNNDNDSNTMISKYVRFQ